MVLLPLHYGFALYFLPTNFSKIIAKRFGMAIKIILPGVGLGIKAESQSRNQGHRPAGSPAGRGVWQLIIWQPAPLAVGVSAGAHFPSASKLSPALSRPPPASRPGHAEA